MGDWPTKYDDADWHYGSDDYQKDWDTRLACTHIGMFIAWAYFNGLMNLQDMHAEHAKEWFERRRRGEGSFGEMTEDIFDEKLIGDDLTDEGRAFADWYYERYLAEFTDFLPADAPSPYHLADNSDTFQKIAALLDARLAEFRLLPREDDDDWAPKAAPAPGATLVGVIRRLWSRIAGGRV